MNREDELFIAKKTAERAGYKVTMPNAAEQPAETPAAAAPAKPGIRHMSRAEYEARKNGQQVPSFADRLDRLAQAARTAEEAGYRIRKMTPADRAAQQAAAPAAPAPAAAPATPPAEKPAETPAPAAEPPKPEEKKFPSFMQNATRFMPPKED